MGNDEYKLNGLFTLLFPQKLTQRNLQSGGELFKSS